MDKTGYVLLNFAAPFVFFWTFHFYGSKPAIALAIITCLVQLAIHRVRRARPSSFFLVMTGFTLFFGTADLIVRTPRFFRLEPFAQNFAIGAAFLISLLIRAPLLSWFIHTLPMPFRPEVDDGYLRRLTIVWMVYFFAKAFLFLYLARNIDLGRLVVLRSVIGTSSFLVLAGGEFIYRHYLRAERSIRHSSRTGSAQPAGAHPSGG